jgi:3-dehydroquinate synthase
MVFVAELARIAGRLSDDVVDRHRSVLGLLGLPISYPAAKWNQLVETMQRDKKSRAGSLRFVVLDDLAKPTIMTAPTPEILHAAFQEIVDS